MSNEPITILAIGIDDELVDELTQDEDVLVERADRLARVAKPGSVDVVLLSLNGTTPLEALSEIRANISNAAVVVVTDPSAAADGAIAVHAGAEDHLVRGSIPRGLLPRAVRYASTLRRLRRELATQDDETGLPNLRGFASIAEHHLRIADRDRAPVVFLFVRVGELTSGGAEDPGALARDAASVLLDAIRDSDVPARIAADTFCVLLTGEARGAETLILSRLVEAIAVHDARMDRPRTLSLSVGSALYEPEHPSTLEQILSDADRRMAGQAGSERSEPS
jgi:diguanylate cyclase (GGDEF)-like protein